jgi:hypothetical protein
MKININFRNPVWKMATKIPLHNNIESPDCVILKLNYVGGLDYENKR